MHETIPVFGVMLRGFVAFSPPDYQRMRSFGGQNRLTISSHTNVSATFSLLSISCCSSTIRNTVFNGGKNSMVIICHIIWIYFSTPVSIFLSLICRGRVLSESYSFLWPFLDQSSARTDPHKGHVQFAHQLWQQRHQTRRSSDSKHKRKTKIIRLKYLDPEIHQETSMCVKRHAFPLCCIVSVEKLKYWVEHHPKYWNYGKAYYVRYATVQI